MFLATTHFNFISFLAIQPQNTLVILWVLLIISILMLFMNSGAEIAFFSIGYKDIKNLRSKKYPGSSRILYLIQEPNHLMSSMLVGNTIFRLLIILLSNYLIHNRGHEVDFDIKRVFDMPSIE
jgi:CBS domain containing-hemolysin-like protein